MFVGIFVAVCLCSAAVAQKLRYDGFQIVKVKVPDTDSENFLNRLIADSDRQITWNSDRESVDPKGYAELMVGPLASKFFADTTFFPEIEVIVSDLQNEFDNNDAAHQKWKQGTAEQKANEFWEVYHDYDEIIEYFDGLVAEFPGLVEKNVSIGKSYEGRDIWALVIGNRNAVSTVDIFWNGLQHCREWIAGHSLMYTADALVRRYSTDSRIRSLLDQTRIHIVPVFNPDGYEYTRTRDNNWRKNRQPNSGSSCVGTDLNRNWRYEWATVGSSNNPCSDTFHGPSAESGPETRAIDRYVRDRVKIQGYMDWHSSGNLWMTPWGCYSMNPPDYNELMATGNRAADAIRSYRGTRFDVGPIFSIIYPVSGSSADTTYAASEMDRVQSYALEIGTSFQPNSREIVPTGEEMLLGALVHVEDTLNRFLAKQK